MALFWRLWSLWDLWPSGGHGLLGDPFWSLQPSSALLSAFPRPDKLCCKLLSPGTELCTLPLLRMGASHRLRLPTMVDQRSRKRWSDTNSYSHQPRLSCILFQQRENQNRVSPTVVNLKDFLFEHQRAKSHILSKVCIPFWF